MFDVHEATCCGVQFLPLRWTNNKPDLSTFLDSSWWIVMYFVYVYQALLLPTLFRWFCSSFMLRTYTLFCEYKCLLNPRNLISIVQTYSAKIFSNSAPSTVFLSNMVAVASSVLSSVFWRKRCKIILGTEIFCCFFDGVAGILKKIPLTTNVRSFYYKFPNKG